MLFKKRKPKKRRKPFKTRYDLTRAQPIHIFEDKMAKGMLREGKEVFVTCFCANVMSLDATATIGSKYRCSPSDNYYNWPEKCYKLGATEIRQYHNHPNVFGRGSFSKTDIQSHRFFLNLLEPYDLNFRSFLLYKKKLGGYVIKELK